MVNGALHVHAGEGVWLDGGGDLAVAALQDSQRRLEGGVHKLPVDRLLLDVEVIDDANHPRFGRCQCEH